MIDAQHVDVVLCAFAHDTYDASEGANRQLIVNTVVAVKAYLPEYVDLLPKAALEIHDWKKGHPGRSSYSVPKDCRFSIAQTLLDTGCAENAQGVLLSSDCHLRIGEIYQLCERNFVFMIVQQKVAKE